MTGEIATLPDVFIILIKRWTHLVKFPVHPTNKTVPSITLCVALINETVSLTKFSVTMAQLSVLAPRERVQKFLIYFWKSVGLQLHVSCAARSMHF
jgi:hypothetical protein